MYLDLIFFKISVHHFRIIPVKNFRVRRNIENRNKQVFFHTFLSYSTLPQTKLFTYMIVSCPPSRVISNPYIIHALPISDTLLSSYNILSSHCTMSFTYFLQMHYIQIHLSLAYDFVSIFLMILQCGRETRSFRTIPISHCNLPNPVCITPKSLYIHDDAMSVFHIHTSAAINHCIPSFSSNHTINCSL